MKRKKPKSLLQPSIKSMKQARKITSDFHRVTRQLESAKADGNTAAVADAESELNKLGGRASYQAASELTTSRHRTSRWVFSLLTKLNLRPNKGQQPLKVLEIGAVNAQIMAVPWLSVRAIDLRPCLPSIEQADFLGIPPAAEYDVMVCAMVLNCVPTAVERGTMLINMRRHLRTGGFAFIVIPLRCLNDSPYTTSQHFEAALGTAGFTIVDTRLSPKLAFYCVKAVEAVELRNISSLFAAPPKKISRGPGKTNDFAVCFHVSSTEKGRCWSAQLAAKRVVRLQDQAITFEGQHPVVCTNPYELQVFTEWSCTSAAVLHHVSYIYI